MTPFAIRAATPGDSQFLAWAILAATRSHFDRGWFDIALNRPEADCLSFISDLIQSRVRSNWHYSHFLVAAVQDLAVAAISAFRAKDAYPLSTAAMVEVIKARGIAAAAAARIWDRGAYIFRCTIRPDDESLVIDTIATLTAHRGKGYSSQLLATALDRGTERGLTQAQISVFIGNVPAERAYTAAGFQLATERCDPDFQRISGAPGIRQYVKPLGGQQYAQREIS